MHQLAQAHPDDAEVAAWTDRLKALWERVRMLVGRPPPAAQGRAAGGAARLEEGRALGAQYVGHTGHPCRALAWRLWPFQDELLTCVCEVGVPADHNTAERLLRPLRPLRPLAVARKISGGTRSPRGSQTRMALSTLVDTWVARGLAPLLACRQLLQSPLPQA